MLNFIYQDQRYKTAGTTTKRARAALFIILDFISSKLLDSVSWLITATLAYLFLVIFYSNMVLFANISLKTKGLAQIAYSVGWLVATVIFFLFLVLIAAYLIMAIIPLFKPPSAGPGVLAKQMGELKKQKAYGYVKNVWDNLKGFFSWQSRGGYRNLYILVILSLAGFFHSWLNVQTANAKLYKYNFLPDFMMVTAREIHRSTWPYVSQGIGYVVYGWNYVWKFASTFLDKLW